jgi:glycosyltransferase involved in cell wall biosynthesis
MTEKTVDTPVLKVQDIWSSRYLLSANEATDALRESEPRVALVHDWLTGMRGGEKVLDLLCRRFPEAPLWTLMHRPGKVNNTIESRTIHTSLLQHMPFAATHYRSYLPLFPLFAELHKAGADADLVISTSHAVAKAMVVRSGKARPFHVCYIHTPMRYVWDMFDEYFGPKRVGTFMSHFVFAPIAWLLQRYDKHTVNRVDLFLANSTYVAERVRRIYGREAIVVAPPVDTARFAAVLREPEEWYLIVSALVPYKRVDLAIRASNALGRSLKVVGVGPELKTLKRLASDLGAKVEFLDFVSDADLGNYYRKAQALLFPGVEDFGIVPVEAIACGCPVIALGVGGVLDSMTDQTAVFYYESTWEALQAAILTFEFRASDFIEATLRSRAQLFSEDNFLSNTEDSIKLALSQFRSKNISTVGRLSWPEPITSPLPATK